MGGKAEKGTPKYIANKIKAKGLQKLRWYCQMCQKQCRDENGFKCHTTSESHQRQLLLFADNSHQYLDQFSKDFADGYLELLGRQFGTKRVNANKVYQDYIANREHVHMNATEWETLTDFVKWLGREGKCTVDETEKGWFVAYIDRDPATIAAQEAAAKKDKMDKDDQEREQEFIQKQVERGKQLFGETSLPATKTELKRESSQERLVLDITLKRKSDDKIKLSTNSSALLKIECGTSSVGKKQKPDENKKKMSAIDEIIKETEMQKERNRRKDYWLTEDIVVKVVTKSLGEKYFKQKGVVEKVVDKYCAHVTLVDSGTKLKLDQNHLQTVIPSIGRQVRFVNGPNVGQIGRLEAVRAEEFCCDVVTQSGRIVKGVAYEDICKINCK